MFRYPLGSWTLVFDREYRVVCDGAAAVVLEKDSSGQLLFQTACGILHDDARRTAMSKAMADLGIRDAAERIYQTILEICK